jgi:hypothetical protein
MQVDIENTFNSVFQIVIFKELCDVNGPLVNIVPFTRLFYGAHSSLYYQHGRHVEGVTILESFSSVRQSNPLRGLLFALAHYQALLKTITRTPNYIFPSLTNNTHIVGPMSELTCTFHHLSTQLTQVGLRVKVQILESFKEFFRHKDSSWLHFGHKWPSYFGYDNGFLGLCHAFFR